LKTTLTYKFYFNLQKTTKEKTPKCTQQKVHHYFEIEQPGVTLSEAPPAHEQLAILLPSLKAGLSVCMEEIPIY